MAKFRTINKKQLTARVLCGLLLSTYLTGAYSLPVAWGASATNASVNVTDNSSGNASSAWGKGTEASGDGSTAFGYSKGGTIQASGTAATAFGYSGEIITDYETLPRIQATSVGATAFGMATLSGTISAESWALRPLAAPQSMG